MWQLALVLLVLPGPCFGAGWPDGISGAEAGRLVRAAMAASGQPAPEFSDPVRGYPACEADPVIGPRAGSWATAELRCASPVWVRSLRTGADPAASIARDTEDAAKGPMLVTLLKSVAKGAVIAADDVGLRPAPTRGVAGGFTDADMVVGRRARVMLGEGQPVLVRQLEPVWLVEKGNPLSLVVTAGGLQVSAPAEALEDGQLGDVVRVRNLSSQREIKAVVTGANIVTAQTNMR